MLPDRPQDWAVGGCNHAGPCLCPLSGTVRQLHALWTFHHALPGSHTQMLTSDIGPLTSDFWGLLQGGLVHLKRVADGRAGPRTERPSLPTLGLPTWPGHVMTFHSSYSKTSFRPVRPGTASGKRPRGETLRETPGAGRAGPTVSTRGSPCTLWWPPRPLNHPPHPHAPECSFVHADTAAATQAASGLLAADGTGHTWWTGRAALGPFPDLGTTARAWDPLGEARRHQPMRAGQSHGPAGRPRGAPRVGELSLRAAGTPRWTRPRSRRPPGMPSVSY